MTLSGNELATLETGLAHMLNWWRAMPRSGERRKQIKNAQLLTSKLSRISDYAYPYSSSDTMPWDVGGEVLMRLDPLAARETRKRARKAEKAF